MRYRLVTFPPPERVVVSGTGARLWPGMTGNSGAAHLFLHWDGQTGFWLVTPAFFSVEHLRHALLAAEGVEADDAPVSGALWRYLARIGSAERVTTAGKSAEGRR